MYIYERKNWTDFIWNADQVLPILSSVRFLQGNVLGKLNTMGFSTSDTMLTTTTLDVIKSSEIEGIKFDLKQVRSSVAKHLNIESEPKTNVDKNIDGVVEMMLDATQNYMAPLTKRRIQGWQAALFPTGYNGINEVRTGKYRNSEVNVVSGPVGREKIHFTGIPAEAVDWEMTKFTKWMNSNQGLDGLIKAAIAHLWFVTIHPFEDGNGRIARAITDMLLARDEKSKIRFYSMSNQLQKERKDYYNKLEGSQRGDCDITEWIVWFLNCFGSAIDDSKQIMEQAITKARFWDMNKETIMNERQIKVVNKLLDGFDGKLTTSKWAKIANTSNDTALRDIKDLISKDILTKTDSGGRSTSYVINPTDVCSIVRNFYSYIDES